MTEQIQVESESGQKFYVNVENVEYPWDRQTITTSEIRTVGNIPSDQPIIEEDPEGTERTLGESETLTLKPGHRLGRAPKYRRGHWGGN